MYQVLREITNPLLIIGIAVALRLVPHPANFAPIGAMALFGGAYLNKKYALAVPLLAMLVSDFFIGFHNTMGFVYASFLLIGILGLWLRRHKNVRNVIGAAFVSSILFFLITNFGVWLVSNIYPKTAAGLIECYVVAIPFFRNTLLGDLFYVGLFFFGYEAVLRFIKSYGQNLHKNRG
ncbi:MAG: hypothetical protein HYV37_00510 [Candidatus Levyibacteriota bacterium]|nr:MAG: hypothetical protein HYV37_00510 [Candidatus Levybacteria bacterium]